MTAQRPHVVVLAGPNGAGKSTAAPTLLRGRLGVTEFVNADTIARGLSGFSPEQAAFDAGRVMLMRLHRLATQRRILLLLHRSKVGVKIEKQHAQRPLVSKHKG